MASFDPWEDGKWSQQHLTECMDDDCERCEWLIDGFYMACDECGHWGQQDVDGGWVMRLGMIFCSDECADMFHGSNEKREFRE